MSVPSVKAFAPSAAASGPSWMRTAEKSDLNERSIRLRRPIGSGRPAPGPGAAPAGLSVDSGVVPESRRRETKRSRMPATLVDASACLFPVCSQADKGFLEQLGQFAQLEPVGMPGGLDRVFEHRHVLGTRDDEVIELAQVDRLADPVLGRSL